MSVSLQASKPSLWASVQSRLFPMLVLLYLVIGVTTLVVAPILASRWLQLPFLGAFVGPTMMVSTVAPSQSGAWELHNLVDSFGYQIMEINGVAVQSTSQLEQELGRYQPGDRVPLKLRAPQGDLQTYDITLQAFPLADQIAFFYTPLLLGLIFLASGLWVFSLRHSDTSGRTFALLCCSVAITLTALFDHFTTHRLTFLWTITLALSGESMAAFALVFPQEHRLVERYPYLVWSGFLPALVLIVIAVPTLYDYARPEAYALSWLLESIYFGLCVVFFLTWMAYGLNTAASPIARERARFILWGSVVAFAPQLVVSAIWPAVRFTPYLLLPTCIFPVICTILLIRHRLLLIDYRTSRLTLYILLGLLIAAGYAALVTGISLLLGGVLLFDNPFVIGGLIFILAALFNPLRAKMQTWADEVFARGRVEYRERLQSFSGELSEAVSQATIVNLLRGVINESFRPTQFHIFVYDLLRDHYVATTGEDGLVTSDLRFTSNSPLVETLSKRSASLYLGKNQALLTSLQAEKARLALLGGQLFVPLPGRQRLTGWLTLGGRGSGDEYTDHDIRFIETLCDQAALALERAQVIANLEHRMQEMNALMRVSQGINITLAFDDMLELIFAQTVQVIAARDFSITLYDALGKYLYHVFYLQDDERLNEREGLPLPVGQGLETVVLESRQPLVTEDYDRECRNRGVLPGAEGRFSWACVPLNAGAETIGVMSLGSRDPSINYTTEQIDLFQAIADQAAGAIIKARLLQESERRALQLTTLNDVARSLTSTLAPGPLLSQILHSAVDILNCEAGSLFLVDEETDELVFEVVTGPVAGDLLGKRLPPGAGMVGKAVNTKEAIIVNDVRRAKEWFAKTDEQTGFVSRDMLVVPMMIKDKVIGVIEVINRKDGLPMTSDDQELLTAFTSQAAVAIENARLYTMTDQALTERVEELSVMQRIDRELNASLDVERAMHITLEWAMRQSSADAGLVGALSKDSIRIMASAGYKTELTGYQQTNLPLEMPALRSAIESGQARFAAIDETNGNMSLLEQARSQLAIPIRREAEVIGAILLESKRQESSSDETLEFLTRLSDHAAIAIANAQLYAEVEAANLAKSEFVSFVSHELKTPMTSIKGFTDLIARGAVGSINENQANFLNTIRSNVDRMATLVSDLADVSRIEAGRLRLDFTAVSVRDIFEEVVRSVRRLVDEKEQSLEVNIPEDIPELWGDRIRLLQVLTNLVSNANKYTPNGGKITLSAELMPSQVVHISVQDTGYGISPEDQKKIFQKFFRSDDQNIRETAGTGLGLNITKTLVEMQGGEIWFTSEYREGTIFHFTVPVVETS